MNWYCTICETINTPKVEDNTQECVLSTLSHDLCVNCLRKKDESNFETHLHMNRLIDKYLPRHQIDIPLSQVEVRLIQPKNWFLYDTTANYIIDRVKYRNYQTWKNWRRNVVYRRIVYKLIQRWQARSIQQIHPQLVLEYLF